MVRRIPRPLALLLAVAALLTTAWSFATAPFQGPDEPAHFNYAQHLAETGSRPSVTEGTHPDSSQSFLALNFMNLDQLAGVSFARPAWSELEVRRFDQLIEDLGEEGARDGDGPNPMAKNPPLYYAYQVVPYQVGSLGSFWDRLVVMRLASGILFLLTVAFTWLAAAEVFAATWPRTIAAGCVALLPQLTSISGTINADNLLITAWTGFLFVALRLVRRGPNVRRFLALCGFAAASLMTHGRGVAILVPLVVVVGVLLLRFRPRPAAALGWLAPGGALLAAVAAAYRLFLTPSTGADGVEVNLGPPGGGLTIPDFLSVTWQFYFPKLPFMPLRPGPEYGFRQVFVESFFGRFATLEIAYPAVVYSVLQAIGVLLVAALVVSIVARWGAVRARWPEVAVVIVFALSMIALLHLASYRAL